MIGMRSFSNWREYRKTVSELRGLSDRELSDLGLVRGDIHAIARKATRN